MLMDSAVRVARATIGAAGARGDDVLAELGDHPGDVPIADSYTAHAALLRVHGLELVRQDERAYRSLAEVAGELGDEALIDGYRELRPLKIAPRASRALARQRAIDTAATRVTALSNELARERRARPWLFAWALGLTLTAGLLVAGLRSQTSFSSDLVWVIAGLTAVTVGLALVLAAIVSAHLRLRALKPELQRAEEELRAARDRS